MAKTHFDLMLHGAPRHLACSKHGCKRERTRGTSLCAHHLDIRIKGEAQAALARTSYLLRPGGRVVRLYAITDGQAVKFGVSNDVPRRLASLQTSSPRKLELLASLWCSEEVERDVHSYLKPSHISGEWFQWNDTAKAIVLLMKANDLCGLLEFMGIEPAQLSLSA